MNKKRIGIVLCALLLSGESRVVAKKDLLKTYREKRDLKKTPEPSGRVAKKGSKKKKALFVIQKHDASHLHYDFRLEIDGVLVSWAVPKGPSTDPRDKRLAIQTEDHPMAYAHFEGVIPEGNYGAGTVMVWDTGTYENIKHKNDELVSMATCLADGQIEIVLQGKKLQGAYTLIKTKWHEGSKNQWLLMKMKDDYVDARRNLLTSEPNSALTGRTMAQIAQEGDDAKKEVEPQKKQSPKKRVRVSKKSQKMS